MIRFSVDLKKVTTRSYKSLNPVSFAFVLVAAVIMRFIFAILLMVSLVIVSEACGAGSGTGGDNGGNNGGNNGGSNGGSSGDSEVDADNFLGRSHDIIFVVLSPEKCKSILYYKLNVISYKAAL